MRIFITGSAGFIGYSLAEKFLKEGYHVFGIDNYDDYYSVKLKKFRISKLKKKAKFNFSKIDISNLKSLRNYLKEKNFDYVYHFAAQPGVRYSLINPKKYFDVNVNGFKNLLKCFEKKRVKSIIYASSSSVYGDQKKFPVKENAILKAKNPYGLSKIINEQTAKIYTKILKIPIIGLRFFTVYGEWGRPDMFIMKFLNSIYKNKTFYLNNSGDHYRDFTYIEDIVDSCLKLMNFKTKKKFIIMNICAGQKVNMMSLTKKILRIYPKAKIKNIGAHKADVYQTLGDNKKIIQELKIKRFTKITIGLKKTIDWFNRNKIYKLL